MSASDEGSPGNTPDSGDGDSGANLKQAVAELCQAQIKFNLNLDFLGKYLYMFIQSSIKRSKD